MYLFILDCYQVSTFVTKDERDLIGCGVYLQWKHPGGKKIVEIGGWFFVIVSSALYLATFRSILAAQAADER